MFIAVRVSQALSPVGTLCLFFYAVPTELNTGRITFFYKHIVPTELKRGRIAFFYKHIVPTELKRCSLKSRQLAKKA